MVASLARAFRDPGLAEEVVQEAYAEALRSWPHTGVPGNATGWLVATARNRALDRLRRDRRYAARVPELRRRAAAVGDEGAADSGLAGDDELAMLFACCHPSLSIDARVALTLRLVAGLQTAEIARGFLVAEATVAQRLVRAKRKLRHAGIPLAVPPDDLLAERLGGVLAVLYLVFTEGYRATTAPSLVRADLAEEAIRLVRLVDGLLPQRRPVRGLLALMLLQHSRHRTRVDDAGRLLLLAEQDRRRWDQAAIREGVALLDPDLRPHAPPPTPARTAGASAYELQAAIAAVHAVAATAADTDWRRIRALYDRLLAVSPSPVVALNRAVAVAEVDGPAAGLALVDALADDPHLARSHLLPATRADLLHRLQRREEATAAYRDALARATNPVERAFLRRRLAEMAVTARPV